MLHGYIFNLLFVCLSVCSIMSVSATPYFDGRKELIGSQVLGSTANIFTYPSLPDLHGGTVSCVWTMSYVTPDPVYHPEWNRWAQAGYMYYASHSALEIFYQYTDVDGYGHTKYLGTPPQSPDEGFCEYSVEQDNEGKWRGYYWGNQIGSTPQEDTDWTADRVAFSGEVQPSTSVQMMGDSENKIRFKYMQYKDADGEWSTGFWPSLLCNPTDDDWAQYIHHASLPYYFEIWDTTP